ncbi:MAG TPA: hypothetical protein VKQ54_07480 [Caulobacteraceae bacterium]|nr:hypothetical protein [Caulobacteraceae bacterium]
MIRTLVILAVVSFMLSIGCIAAAFAIAGGPFNIDDGWRYHRGDWNIDISANDHPPGAFSGPNPAV